VPEYGVAVDLGGDKIAETQAFRLGTELLKPGVSVETVLRDYMGNRPSKDAAMAARKGVRYALDQTLKNARAVISNNQSTAEELAQARAAVKAFSTDNAREKFTMILGGNVADPLVKQIDELGSALATRAAVGGNSRTASRLALAETSDRLMGKGGVGEAAARLQPIETARRAASAVFGANQDIKNEAVRRAHTEMADLFTSTMPGNKTAAEAARVLKDAVDKNRPLSPANRELVSRVFRSVIMVQGGQQGGQTARGSGGGGF
jgi:hypothetical protein